MSFAVDYAGPQPGPEHSRRGGLIAFGIISIILGALSGCMAAFLPLALVQSMAMPRGPGAPSQPQISQILIALAMYALAAGAFLWVGIDSCRCRRWVRPMVLVFAWPWLISGILSVTAMAFVMPDLLATSQGGPPMPRGVAMVMVVVMVATMGVMGVGIPVAYLLFYRSPHVRSTLEFYDLRPSWTERCPLPVLGISVWLALGSLSFLTFLSHGCVPFFGTYVTGAAAAAGIVAVAVAMGWAAYACYRLRPAGWWMCMVLAVALPTSALVSFGRTGLAEYYRRAGFPEEQARELASVFDANGHAMLLGMAVGCMVCVGYLMYARRFFTRAAAVPAPSPVGSRST